MITKKMPHKTTNKFSSNENMKSHVNFAVIAEVISLINRVNLKSPQAKANIISISDNNGKRIIL